MLLVPAFSGALGAELSVTVPFAASKLFTAMLSPVMWYCAVGVTSASMPSTSSRNVVLEPSATKRLRRHLEIMFTFS